MPLAHSRTGTAASRIRRHTRRPHMLIAPVLTARAVLNLGAAIAMAAAAALLSVERVEGPHRAGSTTANRATAEHVYRSWTYTPASSTGRRPTTCNHRSSNWPTVARVRGLRRSSTRLSNRVRTLSARSPARGPGGHYLTEVHPALRNRIHPGIDADAEGARRQLIDTTALTPTPPWSSPAAMRRPSISRHGEVSRSRRSSAICILTRYYVAPPVGFEPTTTGFGNPVRRSLPVVRCCQFTLRSGP
jgi:hypothetical protein